MQYSFKKLNLIVGWLSFVLASTVYLLTMEPTASFWDCSEFIATSYKLEVGHPPGAPLFMMISRFFTMFGGPGQAAVLVNSMSALASGATVMFLFWTITHLARRAMRKSGDELTLPQTIAVLGAGLIGAGAYTFTDTFWFSAVEGEVYALSSMFTALVFWAILKWENVADEPHANRWIVLIAYLTGLAIGVHLLNLLIIPPIALIYYFRKYPRVTKWGVVKSLLVSAAALIFVMKFIIAGTVNLGAFFDRMFVNGLGLPVNSGITFFALALLAVLGWGVYWTHKRGKVLANTILLCTAVIIVGYGSYASVIIRSAANPPMNSNAPSNPYGLLSLLNRDQYGARPLFKGPYYSSPVAGIKESTVYYEDEGKYKAAKTVTAREYDPRFEFFFPRMYSDKESDIKAYKNWVDIEGRQIPYDDETVTVPTFAENLKFFFAYQLNFMYWRYFLWNFVGRQSDIQSTGEITDGNWLSGIDAVDRIFLGPQDNLPQEQASNKGRNTYYFLPFILGIIGLIYQLNRDGRNFSVVMAFFIMTGVAIAVYLNSPPAEPRERDYVFAGSFYAFAMWIGFGVPVRGVQALVQEGRSRDSRRRHAHRSRRTDDTGRPELGRPRPVAPLCGARFRRKLPELHAAERHHHELRRQRHVPAVVRPRGGRSPQGRAGDEHELPGRRVVHRSDAHQEQRLGPASVLAAEVQVHLSERNGTHSRTVQQAHSGQTAHRVDRVGRPENHASDDKRREDGLSALSPDRDPGQ